MESIGGNIYINMAGFSFLDIIASFFVSILILKFDLMSNLNFICKLGFFVCSLFIFYPKTSKGILYEYFFIFSTLLAKSICDVYLSIMMITNTYLIPKSKILTMMLIAQPIARFVLLFLPYINYFFRFYLNTHPFVFIAILFLILNVLSKYLNFNFKMMKIVKIKKNQLN